MTYSLIVSTDLTDVTLVSDDTFRRLSMMKMKMMKMMKMKVKIINDDDEESK